MSEDELEHMMLCALAEHHRTYRCSEWRYIRAFKEKKPVQKQLLDSLLREFSVARTINSKTKENVRENCHSWAEKIPTNCNEPGWKQVLERAKKQGVQFRKKTKSGSQSETFFVSGMTKVMWFATQYQWPMFDTYTARALGIPQGKPALERARLFYKSLEVREYSKTHQAIQSKCNSIGEWAKAERVMDKFLMYQGSKNLASNSVSQTISDSKDYLALLPKEEANTLVRTAQEISNQEEVKQFLRI
ncbi:hypothetical protein SAMN05444000_10487 [Shimia gijangensis]|uniref:Uncharacterized protein n=1 Tax=Shimia gijangensis TaxID=1470563 RepID=A0A1M6FIY6_9RHOB|nr:hypothetical protein [Shimia gijangensis]SHI97654.1 hypothetical protein SAMN05444000_10487 [Shimia gijangensis]